MTDHKIVGLQYAVTSSIFFLVGFKLMLLMRWQLAWPAQPLPPWLAPMVGDANAPGGIMLPEFYNQLVAMHGTVMIFLAVVPLATGGFGTLLVPPMIGAARATTPRLLWPAVAVAMVIAGDAILLATRALPAWHARMAPPPPAAEPPLEIRVIAEQFAWQIHYPGPDGEFGLTDASHITPSNPIGIDRASPDAADDIGLTNVLVMPIGRTIVVQLTSRDVIHSFTLAEMRVKQDATPGFVTRTWFTPVQAGSWEIGCSQLCGLGHYRMRGEYRVVSAEAWATWIADEVERLR